MKSKRFIIIAIALLVFTFSGCIIINAPADSAPTTAQTANATSVPTATGAPAPPPAPTPAPIPTPTPLTPVTVIDQPTTYANTYISVNVHCPEIGGMQDTMMQSGINTGVSGYLTGNASALEQQSIQDATNFGAHAPYSYETSFTVMRNDGNLLSILINISSYEGGAHTANTFATINAVNSNPGDQWVLCDLFVPGTDYVTQLNSKISAIIAADANMNGAFWFSTIDANQTFYLTDTHLVVLFEAYTIAPGAYGAPQFEIPLSALSGLVSF